MDLKSVRDQIEKTIPNFTPFIREVDLGINPIGIKKLAKILRIRYHHSNFSNMIFGGILKMTKNLFM